MFGTSKKSIVDLNLLNGFCDMHTHIMWGVDDGMHAVDESLDTLKWYEQQGIEWVCLTPHVMEDIPENTSEFLQSRFDEIKAMYNGKVKLNLGAEYMLDSAFEKHLNSGKLLTISASKVLVETSVFFAPLGFDDMLYKIQTKDYNIILAHPERYGYMRIKTYEQLKQQNISLQLNMFSLLGSYGQEAKEKSYYLLRNNMYDYVGSDIHRLKFHIRKFNEKTLKNNDAALLKSLIDKNRSLLSY
jgi:tyrosine-protein phosphatase YwqE